MAGKETYLDLIPPYTWENEYGLELYQIYHDTFPGLWTLFKRGVTGLCCDEKAPLLFREFEKITGDVVALPENVKDGEIPTLSEGSHMRCRIQADFGSRCEDRIFLRGLLSCLIEDQTREGVGDLAVCVCNTLAVNGVIPFPSKSGICIALRDVDLKVVGSDVMVEMLVTAHPKARSILPFPVEPDGSLDLSMLREIAEAKR